ncbi:hypothetical protein LA02_1528 [Francisella philomiragia]|uniref:hypothetical protein n=1 Tax=Francisella philomiragia TaxID=28110 RepID=UPI0005A57650|nr:hypothetical protein [Francisella philomiragia]AJI56890.1 hypothetical protein LA02_1528 [Francisella philomiragia]
MRQIKNYFDISDNYVSISNLDSRTAAESKATGSGEPRLLLGDGFKIKVSGTDVELTPFKKLYKGGQNEAETNVVATLERLYIKSQSTAGFSENNIVFHTSVRTAVKLEEAYNQSANKEVEVTIGSGSLLSEQFYFQPPQGTDEKPKWGDAISFKTDLVLSSFDSLSIHTEGTVALVEIGNLKAKDNFDISYTSSNTSDQAKIVTTCLSNN